MQRSVADTLAQPDGILTVLPDIIHAYTNAMQYHRNARMLFPEYANAIGRASQNAMSTLQKNDKNFLYAACSDSGLDS